MDFVTQKIIHVDSLKCRPNSPDIIFIQQMIEAVTTSNIRMEWDRWQLGVSTSTTLQPDGYSCGTRVRFYAAVAATGLSSSFDDSAMRYRNSVDYRNACPNSADYRRLTGNVMYIL